MLPNYMPLCNVIKEISIPYPLQSEINLELLRRENRKSKKIMQTKKKKAAVWLAFSWSRRCPPLHGCIRPVELV